MILVHHLNNSRSQRILWLLEELGLDYEIVRYEREPSGLAPPSLLKVHPLGKSPVITDGELTIAESGAIIEYLIDRYGNGRLIPAVGTAQRLRYTYWLHFAEGSAMSPLLLRLYFEKVAQAPVPFFVKPVVKGISRKVIGDYVQPQIERQLDYIEAELAGSPWFAGAAFTAADIQMSFPLEASVGRAGLGSSRPKTMAFLDRIHKRVAYQRALKKGGEYDLTS